jgi:hypothetical protein
MIEGVFAWIALIYGVLDDQPLFIVACAIFAVAAQIARGVEYQIKKFKNEESEAELLKRNNELKIPDSPKVIVDRIRMIDEAKLANNNTDLDTCQFYQNYLKHQFGNEILSPMIQVTKLSNRNVGCMKNVLEAMKMGNVDNFWMELSDFIENYRCEEPITYVEYQVFTTLFEFGTENFCYEVERRQDE